MAILEKCELWFPKLDPARPNARFNKTNPTWEVQIRTSDKEVKKQWEALNLSIKGVIPEEEGAKPYWRVNLNKKSLKKTGEPNNGVAVVDAQLKEVAPNSIGNGSLGNVRIWQYDYQKPEGGTGIGTTLMSIQLLKHIVYVPQPRDDDFKAGGETETIVPEMPDDFEDSPM